MPRRTKDHAGQAYRSPDQSGEPSWTADELRHDGMPDTSYEAAMRAADALFAKKREPADPAGEQTDLAPADRAGTDLSAETLEPAKQEGRGRILQAIEDTPADISAMVEAEHAPRKRGRKPGSKNKIKPALPALDSGVVRDAAAELALAADRDGVVLQDEADVIDDEIVAFDPGPGENARIAFVGTPRTRERYAWVRTKLRPGEQWKRRLPKVAW